MTISVDELATKAMSLSGEARALLAEKLVESLDQESVRGIWLTEAKRRRDEVRNGQVKPILVLTLWKVSASCLMTNDIFIPPRGTC
jgi:hypothetical protein